MRRRRTSVRCRSAAPPRRRPTTAPPHHGAAPPRRRPTTAPPHHGAAPPRRRPTTAPARLQLPWLLPTAAWKLASVVASSTTPSSTTTPGRVTPNPARRGTPEPPANDRRPAKPPKSPSPSPSPSPFPGPFPSPPQVVPTTTHPSAPRRSGRSHGVRASHGVPAVMTAGLSAAIGGSTARPHSVPAALRRSSGGQTARADQQRLGPTASGRSQRAGRPTASWTPPPRVGRHHGERANYERAGEVRRAKRFHDGRESTASGRCHGVRAMPRHPSGATVSGRAPQRLAVHGVRASHGERRGSTTAGGPRRPGAHDGRGYGVRVVTASGGARRPGGHGERGGSTTLGGHRVRAVPRGVGPGVALLASRYPHARGGLRLHQFQRARLSRGIAVVIGCVAALLCLGFLAAYMSSPPPLRGSWLCWPSWLSVAAHSPYRRPWRSGG
ncbi:hypothetical protein BJY14_004274 [Actinomadura luteofluorescens]|uniref:Uncharacterized protein n=1 Tax=Actinomadura luteofluorescens TaxID=46163 RepID=A0A7Y9JH26_9ACTN|nr:hypothetical protein [Actinomadura luteofluorescens]